MSKSKARSPPPGMENVKKTNAPPGMENVLIDTGEMSRRFLWTFMQLYGYSVSVQAKDGEWYTGILSHMNEKTFDITLDMVTKKNVREKSEKKKVFRSQDIVQLLAEEVDTRNVAKKDLKFMTTQILVQATAQVKGIGSVECRW